MAQKNQALTVVDNLLCKVELVRVDYDQPGTDTGDFIELRVESVGGPIAQLSACGLTTLVVYGSGNCLTPSLSVNLAGVLVPSNGIVVLDAPTLNLQLGGAQEGWLRNTASDIGILAPLGGALAWASYEGGAHCEPAAFKSQVASLQTETDAAPNLTNVWCNGAFELVDASLSAPGSALQCAGGGGSGAGGGGGNGAAGGGGNGAGGGGGNGAGGSAGNAAGGSAGNTGGSAGNTGGSAGNGAGGSGASAGNAFGGGSGGNGAGGNGSGGSGASAGNAGNSAGGSAGSSGAFFGSGGTGAGTSLGGAGLGGAGAGSGGVMGGGSNTGAGNGGVASSGGLNSGGDTKGGGINGGGINGGGADTSASAGTPSVGGASVTSADEPSGGASMGPDETGGHDTTSEGGAVGTRGGQSGTLGGSPVTTGGRSSEPASGGDSAGDAAQQVEGGGCTCNAVGRPARAPWQALLGLAVVAMRRRRREGRA